MPVLSKRGLRKLQKVLEDWISEDWSDSSDNNDEFSFTPLRSTRGRGMRTMENNRSDAASSSASEHPGTSSEDERMSSRMSSCSSSAATDHLPPPPKYESVIQLPMKDYSKKGKPWDREVDQIVGDFDRKCSTMTKEHSDGVSTAKSYIHEERSSRRSMSPPTANSNLGIERNFDWDRSLLSNDGFFRDSTLRQRRPFAGRSLGGMRSGFGEDMDRFFGRGTFSTDWDTFFPEITFSDFGRTSNLASRNQAKPRDVEVVQRGDDFKIEVDVQGFGPNELLVKTVGQSLLVMARTEAADDGEKGASKKCEFRELRREFTIPPTVNPTDIISDLTPEGTLVIQAPTRNKLSIESRDDGENTKTRYRE